MEGIVSLTIWSLIVPSLLLFYQMIMVGWRESYAKEELIRSFSRFQSEIIAELEQAEIQQVGTDWLHLSAGDRWIRYHFQKGKVIRSVRKEGSKRWKGTTILLESVTRFRVKRFDEGFYLKVWLTNQHASFMGETFYSDHE